MNRYTSTDAQVGHLLTLLALCTLLAGCDTRRDIFDDRGVWVRIEADWTPSGILPEGTSIYLFGQETGEPVGQLLTNDLHDGITRDSIKLHAGHYSLLVFNETERSHDYISFRGTDRYHTAEAYTNPLELPANSRYAQYAATLMSAPVHTTASSSDVLAAAHIDRFEVDYDMIRDQVCPPLQFTPQRLSVTVEVIIHVQNMHSLHTGRQQAGALNNMAGGVFLSTDAPNDVPATHWFALSTAAFDPDTKNGTLRATFGSFGALDTGSNALWLSFLLRDDTEYTVERDVTAQLHRATTTPERRLTVEIGLALTDDDPPIVLPDIPADDGGMFEVDVGDWDDNTDIDIPI
jgi:hypothetical protein